MNNYYIYTPKKKGGNWVLRIKRKSDSKRFQKSFNASQYSKTEVQNIAKQIEAKDLIENKDDVKYNPFDYLTESANLMLGEAVDLFLDYHQSEVKESTLSTYEKVLSYFTEEHGRNVYVKAITFHQIKKFILSRTDKLTSANAYLTPFRKLYSFLNKRYDINYAPQFETIGNKRKRSAEKHKTPDIVSEEEVWEMYEYGKNIFTKPNHLVNLECIIIYFYTGMRTEELPHLKVKDIDLKNETLRVGNNKATKTYQPRDIWVPTECHEQFKSLMKGKSDDEYIINHDRADGQGNMMRSNYWVWNKILNELYPEKPSFPPYNLRHSNGCWLVENRFSVLFIKNQLGHKNLDQILTYVHMTKLAFKKEIQSYKEAKKADTEVSQKQ